MLKIERLGDEPIITPGLCGSIGTNIQGPSLIAAPPWIERPLGAYYLYFADHKGGHIRLAYADDLLGPWKIHEPGALQLEHSCFLTEAPEATSDELAEIRSRFQKHYGSEYSIDEVMADATTPHIASPDVHVDHEAQHVVMYFHGLDKLGVQSTRVAIATDGIAFQARPEVLGRSYFRVFEFDGWHYALVMPGQVRRSRDGFTDFKPGPKLFGPTMRHSAVRRRGNVLDVFWSRVGDSPESILHSTIDLNGDWMAWRETQGVQMLKPELEWEGAMVPAQPSRRGAVNEQVNQLRDPAIFVEGNNTYLLYSAAGETCIGLAQVLDS